MADAAVSTRRLAGRAGSWSLAAGPRDPKVVSDLVGVPVLDTVAYRIHGVKSCWPVSG